MDGLIDRPETTETRRSRHPASPSRAARRNFMLKLQVILGSTRSGRHADAVHRWLLPVAQSLGVFEIETLDLRDWPLPFFQETFATLGDLKDPTWSDPIVRRWN